MADSLKHVRAPWQDVRPIWHMTQNMSTVSFQEKASDPFLKGLR
jgi:hypothetical protein